MNARAFDPNNPASQRMRKQVTNPLVFAAFLGAKLPLALVAGLRIRALDADHCTATVRYRWLTTNPFRSTYFAALAMAAEMSTGALGLSLVRASPEPVSMLIVGMSGEFTKKAVGLTTFTCRDGVKVQAAVVGALGSSEGVTVQTETVGVDESGDEVARFRFTWSFRKKRS
jgi:hypothetical protein